MAKYEIRHACGHTAEYQICGPARMRESNISWREGQDCPSCWAEKKRQKEAPEPIVMHIRCNGLDCDEQGNLLAEVVLTGGTIARKDEIKLMGYQWDTPRGSIFHGGLGGLLSTSQPVRRWLKMLPLASLIEPPAQGMAQLKEEAAKLAASMEVEVGPLEAAMIQRHRQKEMKIAAIPKPQRPACHPFSRNPSGKWNGEYYGDDRRGHRYYIDGEEISLTREEYAELMAYRQALDDYKKRVAEIKSLPEEAGKEEEG